MSWVAFVFWVGGVIPAYRHARKNRCNVVSSGMSALCWPADVGWKLADWACDTHKE